METGDSDDDASSVPMDLSQPSPDKRMVSESVDQELLGLKIFPEMLKKAELSSFPQEYQRIDQKIRSKRRRKRNMKMVKGNIRKKRKVIG